MRIKNPSIRILSKELYVVVPACVESIDYLANGLTLQYWVLPCKDVSRQYSSSVWCGTPDFKIEFS